MRAVKEEEGSSSHLCNDITPDTTRLTRITLLRLICVWSAALFSGAAARLSTHPEPDT